MPWGLKWINEQSFVYQEGCRQGTINLIHLSTQQYFTLLLFTILAMSDSMRFWFYWIYISLLFFFRNSEIKRINTSLEHVSEREMGHNMQHLRKCVPKYLLLGLKTKLLKSVCADLENNKIKLDRPSFAHKRNWSPVRVLVVWKNKSCSHPNQPSSQTNSWGFHFLISCS